MTARDSFLGEAADLLGPKGFTTDAEAMSPWLTDWRGRFTGRALAMASPASTAEVAALVALCARNRVPIVPQGGNSGMCGGATPDEEGGAILLSLRRMNAVRSFVSEARQVVCEAGVVLQTLHETAQAEGLRFPLTLGGKGSATVGGLVSTNAGGTQVLRHGSMRAQVLGLEAVVATGEVYSALTPLKKDNRGFDLKQLLIGSEGTLGIVTAATLRLLPAIADRQVLWVGVPSLEAARALLLHAEAKAGPALEGFEVLAQETLDDVIEYLPNARPPLEERHEWHALIELVADKASAERLPGMAEELLSTALEANLLEDAAIAANETQAEAFWLLRDSIASAERAKGPAVQHDISVAVERMPAFVSAAVGQIERSWPGTRAIAFGHLGDGNVHFHVIAPPGAEPIAWQVTDGKAISDEVYGIVTDWNGSISAEHGIGQLKRDTLERLGDPVALGMMRAVKDALDPLGILNPGKLLALAPGNSSN
ncbi:FAD-binding oxidoreductase [Tsuneonella sp. HG249]